MKWMFAAAVLLLVSAGGVMFLGGRNRRLRKAKDQAESAARSAVKRVERTVRLQERQQKIREEAGEENAHLDEASDSDLLDRANNLFG